ncbi:hypothetical protein [Frankia tisae]|uniref:hypothetical protein n=1 Tax=Frankia tisae TaxID=2950104 RepID=UPI0021BE97ED|nr:hypothetical protein [Frankia tisae]
MRQVGAVVDWLNVRDHLPWFTSTLAEVEVTRAIRRTVPEALGHVPRVLDRMYRLDIDTQVEAFVTYDKRLLEAARRADLPTASPGPHSTAGS